MITPATWAGSVPQVGGIAPRLRVGRSKWFNLLRLLPIGFVLLIAPVAVAQGLRNVPSVERFIAAHPGTITPTAGAATGFPAWLRWQHFFNVLFMIIIRSGVQILSDHPRLYLTRHCTPGRDWFRIQKPVPADPLQAGCSSRSNFVPNLTPAPMWPTTSSTRQPLHGDDRSQSEGVG